MKFAISVCDSDLVLFNVDLLDSSDISIPNLIYKLISQLINTQS